MFSMSFATKLLVGADNAANPRWRFPFQTGARSTLEVPKHSQLLARPKASHPARLSSKHDRQRRGRVYSTESRLLTTFLHKGRVPMTTNLSLGLCLVSSHIQAAPKLRCQSTADCAPTCSFTAVGSMPICAPDRPCSLSPALSHQSYCH